MFDLIQVLCLPARRLAQSPELHRWTQRTRQLHTCLWLLCAGLSAVGVLALVAPPFPGCETPVALAFDLATVALFTSGSRRLLQLEALSGLARPTPHAAACSQRRPSLAPRAGF